VSFPATHTKKQLLNYAQAPVDPSLDTQIHPSKPSQVNNRAIPNNETHLSLDPFRSLDRMRLTMRLAANAQNIPLNKITMCC
jgi:hypothetical protein